MFKYEIVYIIVMVIEMKIISFNERLALGHELETTENITDKQKSLIYRFYCGYKLKEKKRVE